MEWVQLPLTNDPAQVKTFTIDPDGVTRAFRVDVRWRDHVGKWTMSISNAQSGDSILSELPLTGSAPGCLNDILGQYGHLRIGSIFLLPNAADDYYTDPGKENLTGFALVWGDHRG